MRTVAWVLVVAGLLMVWVTGVSYAQGHRPAAEVDDLRAELKKTTAELDALTRDYRAHVAAEAQARADLERALTPRSKTPEEIAEEIVSPPGKRLDTCERELRWLKIEVVGLSSRLTTLERERFK